MCTMYVKWFLRHFVPSDFFCHLFNITLPVLVLTILTVESSDPVATSTLSLCPSMQVIDP